MRTLPLRLSPVDGESLVGYVLRYAHTFGLQPGDVVRALGLDDGAGSVAAAGSYGVSLSADQLHRAAFATGIASERLEAMLLARFAAFLRSSVSGPVMLASEAMAHEVFIWSSRHCPQCLRTDGAWLLRWQLGWSIICVRHGVLLVRHCPHCNLVPRIGLRAKWPRDRGEEISDPCCCSHRHRRQLCRAPLTSARTVAVSSDLLAGQRRIDALHAGNLRPTLAGEALDPPVYLRDLRALANILREGPRADAPRTRASSGGSRLLDNPDMLAAVLPEAIRLASQIGPRSPTDATTTTATRSAPAPAAKCQLHSRPCCDAQQTKPSMRARRNGWGLTQTPTGAPLDLDLQARHVPQLF